MFDQLTTYHHARDDFLIQHFSVSLKYRTYVIYVIISLSKAECCYRDMSPEEINAANFKPVRSI